MQFYVLRKKVLLFLISVLAQLISCLIRGGQRINSKQPWGWQKGGRVIRYLRNTARYIIETYYKHFHHLLSIPPSFVQSSPTLSVHFAVPCLFSCAHPTTHTLSLGWTMPSWIKINKIGALQQNIMLYIFQKIISWTLVWGTSIPWWKVLDE